MTTYEIWEQEYKKSRREIVIATLRVNVKSLAAEARFIRREVAKASSCMTKNELQLHRAGKLREESRTTQLALAAVRNKPYEAIERNPKTPPDWASVKKKIERHCEREIRSDALAWVTKAISSTQRENAAGMTLTSADIDDATDHLMREAGQHFRFGLLWRESKYGTRRDRIKAFVNWCARRSYGIQLAPVSTEMAMRYDARLSPELKEKCGSIFIMLIGNLLIQLFILWLKRRLENK